MPGLIEELTLQASEKSTLASDLLRRMKIATVRLGLDDLDSWVEHELEGYAQDDPLPDYRFIHGIPQTYHAHWGWRNMRLSENSDSNALFSFIQYRQPLDGLESMLDGEGPYHLTYPRWFEEAALPHLPHGVTKMGLFVDRASLVTIPGSVRNKVLGWSLKMEKAGITGEGHSFTQAEKKAAQNVVYNIDMRGGNQNRANINSTDLSSNTLVAGDLFGDIRQSIKRDVEDPKAQKAMLAAVDDMEAQTDKKGLAAAYGKFMAVAADHIGVVQPFMPLITDLLANL